MPTIVIDAEALQPFEVGANLMALLAFPGCEEMRMRERAAQAWCSEILRATELWSPAIWADICADQILTRMDERTTRRSLITTKTRFRDRMLAAKMVRGFFGEMSSARPTALPPSMKRFSINELANFVLPESGESDPDNLEKRAWRRSLPVIHLASAFDVVGSLVNPGMRDFPYDPHNMDVHRWVVRLARRHECYVEAHPKLRRAADKMLRVRWKNDIDGEI